MREADQGDSRPHSITKLPRLWYPAHVLAWAAVFAIALGTRTPIQLVIADIVNAVVCPLASPEQSSTWGGSGGCLYGIDPGLAVGSMLSTIFAVALVGLASGLTEAWAINRWWGASWWFALLTVSLASGTALFALWIQPFLGILNVIIGGVSQTAASAVMGLFLGATLGLGFAFIASAVLHSADAQAA